MKIKLMARATNTGYSAIVDYHGNSICLSELNQYEIYAGNIYSGKNKTLYVKWDDWLVKIGFIYLITCLMYRCDRRKNH